MALSVAHAVPRRGCVMSDPTELRASVVCARSEGWEGWWLGRRVRVKRSSWERSSLLEERSGGKGATVMGVAGRVAAAARRRYLCCCTRATASSVLEVRRRLRCAVWRRSPVGKSTWWWFVTCRWVRRPEDSMTIRSRSRCSATAHTPWDPPAPHPTPHGTPPS
jgi:hypothetical protein